MLTVMEGREESAQDGSLRCPSCQGTLRPWGYARVRLIRVDRGHRWVRPRRARCRECGRTQVLLPSGLLERRRDAVTNIGTVLEAYAQRTGYRRAARDLAIPVPTARNWVRQLRGRWSLVTDRLEPAGPSSVSTGPDDPRAAVAVVHRSAARAGWQGEPWVFASMATNGRLLAYNTT
jgi:hypothetical protein